MRTSPENGGKINIKNRKKSEAKIASDL